MANRAFSEFGLALEKGLVNLFSYVQTASSGTVITLQSWNPNNRTYAAAATGGFRGIKSVTRTGTGAWSLILQDTYQRALQVNALSVVAGGLAAAPVVSINSSNVVSGGVTYVNNVNTTTSPGPCINLQFSAAGAATDPGATSNELILLQICLQNSTAL